MFFRNNKTITIINFIFAYFTKSADLKSLVSNSISSKIFLTKLYQVYNPSPSRFLLSSYASFNRGLIFPMFNLQKYNMACVLINDAIENLPSSNLAEKLQAVFFNPNTDLQYLLCTVSNGNLSYKYSSYDFPLDFLKTNAIKVISLRSVTISPTVKDKEGFMHSYTN